MNAMYRTRNVLVFTKYILYLLYRIGKRDVDSSVTSIEFIFGWIVYLNIDFINKFDETGVD